MTMKCWYMTIKLNYNSFFIFDLDDTIFREIDFLQSAYWHIAQKIASCTGANASNLYNEMWLRYQSKENVFALLVQQYQTDMPSLTLQWLLQEYREHIPKIEMIEGTAAFLDHLKQRQIPIGLITDGRSTTQRNKLKALNILNEFSDIIISEEFGSEKPDERNYLYFANKYPASEFYFIGDNIKKDFIVPVKLGWKTICIKDAGTNIHTQDLTCKPLPDYIVSSLTEITFI